MIGIYETGQQVMKITTPSLINASPELMHALTLMVIGDNVHKITPIALYREITI